MACHAAAVTVRAYSRRPVGLQKEGGHNGVPACQMDSILVDHQRRTIKWLAGLLLGLSLSLSAHAEYVIKFSHVVSPQTPKGVAADWFATEVNKRLAG